MRRRIILEGGVKTEKVTVQVTMSDGASAQGITVTINGSATTTNADGVAYGEVPYDTTYSVVFSQKDSTYSTPATQSFTASIETRQVSATYTKYYETCTVTSNIATTITINGNKKTNTKSHSRSIPYGTTYTVNVLSSVGEYTASTTSYTYTASTSSRPVTFTYTSPYNGHAYVDLGLPSGTLWATMNVGASSASECGNYYKYGYGATQYSKNTDYYLGNENPLPLSRDTARQVWGGSWHMPSDNQFLELTANTTYQWTSINGVNGGKFTSKTDTSKYIFLPAAGNYSPNRDEKINEGVYGYYWSSRPFGRTGAYSFYATERGPSQGDINRYLGISVRPVIG